VPIVIVTEEDDVDIIRLAYDCGATDFISKPVNWPLLPYRLQFILRASTAMRSARSNERLLAEAQRIARMGNWIWDLSDEEMQVSDAICRIFDVPMASPCVFYQLFINAIHDEDKKALERAIERALAGDTADVELRIRRQDGMQRTLIMHAESNPQAGNNHLLGTMQDITDRKKADEAIRKLAFYDQVTGLPNRTLFREHLSMAYLKHFPIDVLKVDRSFIMDIPDDELEATITTAIVKLAHALNLTVVAEGVENAEQLHFLSALNCDQIQGYLFSPPVPADKAAQLINETFTIGKN
jgi:PAS domain S-box-containing protein